MPAVHVDAFHQQPDGESDFGEGNDGGNRAGGGGVAGDQQLAHAVEQIANSSGDEQEAQHLGEVARLHNQVTQNQHVGHQKGDANRKADAVRVEEQRDTRALTWLG